VDQLLLRGEFFTAYTPYQPEIAQGTLQALFEWQTFVTLLTGLEVSNASMYDGATATAEAVLLATRATSRDKIVVSAAVHPEYRKVLATYLASTGDEIVTVPYGADGRTDLAALEAAVDDRTAAVVVGYPNFFGVVDALPEAAAIARRGGALAVAVTAEAVSLGLLQAPGALGADVAVGTMQSFGNGLNFGGPAPGFLAIREGLLRQMPGRVAGATVDRTGRRGFVLTLSTREQHIRREKATSNICTNAGLAALAATIHLSLLGKGGLAHLARLNHARGRQLREAMRRAGFGPRFSGPTFNEAAFDVGDAEAVVERLSRAGIAAGVPLSRWYPDDPRMKGSLLSVATEVHTPELIELFAQAVKG
jgi:glycine dehydrogenase subunit 1